MKVLVLTGDGINCEHETAWAFGQAGGNSTIEHINDLLSKPEELLNYDILALPGGFSFGDDLASGKVLALKLKHGLGSVLKDFKRPIIGICNGFQALVKLGLLGQESMALASNSSGKFINRWSELKVQPSACIWTKKLEGKKVSFPIRHGEGRFVLEKADSFEKLKQQKQLPLFYQQDENGSYANIAGVCDPSGLVFGLMPHPEAAIKKELAPAKEFDLLGLAFFESALEYMKEQKRV